MRLPILLAAVLLAAVPARGVELVTNGQFELPLDSGWQQDVSGGSIDRATNYDPDPDYEVWCYKATGAGFARLLQTISLQGVDVDFSAALRVAVSATSTAWAAAGLSLTYLDAAQQPLGETFVGVHTQYCPWSDSPTFHIVYLDPSVWQTSGFSIQDELVNLSGVDPDEVKAVQVMVHVEVYDC